MSKRQHFVLDTIVKIVYIYKLFTTIKWANLLSMNKPLIREHILANQYFFKKKIILMAANVCGFTVFSFIASW